MKLRTANSTDMRISAAVSTANIAGIADGEWALIAPFGDHPAPDGSYVQRFQREQSDAIVKTWNSIAGSFSRRFKNLFHGLGARDSVPAWDGHPETDPKRWPQEKLLCEVTDLRTGEDGLEGKLKWSANGLKKRARGPLYPSPLWWHMPPAGNPPTVYPELLESIGLVPEPNIAGVPAWTQNATLASFEASQTEPTQNQPNNPMTEEQLKALRKALGLPETADPAACIAGALAAQSTANAHGILATANATLAGEKAGVEVKLQENAGLLTTANANVTTVTTERDQLRTSNGALTAERDAFLGGLLDLAEKKGAIAPADREGFKTRLSTANTAAAAIAELQTRKALNVEPVKINGNRVDLTTSNSRAAAFNDAVSKRMKLNGCDYDTAFAACLADPELGPLTAAMQDPARRQG